MHDQAREIQLDESFAHSPSATGRVETVAMHLHDVARRAAEFATPFGAEEEAYLAGLLHDLGKYGALFQQRLRGEAAGVDHWSAGAIELLRVAKGQGVAGAAAVAGHHVGLPALSKAFLQQLTRIYDAAAGSGTPRLSSADPEWLRNRAGQDGVAAHSLAGSIYDYRVHLEKGFWTVAGMLDVRMLYSALVDADFVETEAHFLADASGGKRYRSEPPPLLPERALAAVLKHTDSLQTASGSSDEVAAARAEVLSCCLEAASADVGLFTLTAPTGTGKTLAMLAFALRHAALHGLSRVILVVPYLSILEQTARVYRAVLDEAGTQESLQSYVLEDHSLAGDRGGSGRSGDQEDLDRQEERMLSAAKPSWNAPVVLTTSVQMLESLFACRPRACRKLHRLSRAVILFDEVQTLPLHLAVPTLAALSRLSARYGTSVVFSTATQPAFSELDRSVRSLAQSGWSPTEIVPPGRVRVKPRVSVKWPVDSSSCSWEEVAERISSVRQIMCVVNLKKQAIALFQILRTWGCEGVHHLSTNMCPQHRLEVLGDIREALSRGEPCRLVATQCVEAGVDIDFPEVMRAFGPLDAIIQAAGRCNRNGARDIGRVTVFQPEEEAYPDGAYRRAADVTRLVLRSAGGSANVDDVALHRAYYSSLYSVSEPAALNVALSQAIEGQDFQEVARSYRLIERAGIEVLVPWREADFIALAEEAREGCLSAEWVRRARPHAVNLFRPRQKDAHRYAMEPVRLGHDRWADDWFIYLNADHYDPDLGLVIPDGLDLLIA